MRALLVCSMLAAFAACTPGAAAPPGGGRGGASSVVIDVNLTLHPASASAFGTLGGYGPPTTSVALGSNVQFINSDSFAHTATSIAASSFPSGSPFQSSAQNQSGAKLSGLWSTGAIGAGASSQPILVDKAGTYFYGCFFHYGSPMRGVIVAQ